MHLSLTVRLPLCALCAQVTSASTCRVPACSSIICIIKSCYSLVPLPTRCGVPIEPRRLGWIIRCICRRTTTSSERNSHRIKRMWHSESEHTQQHTLCRGKTMLTLRFASVLCVCSAGERQRGEMSEHCHGRGRDGSLMPRHQLAHDLRALAQRSGARQDSRIRAVPPLRHERGCGAV